MAKTYAVVPPSPPQSPVRGIDPRRVPSLAAVQPDEVQRLNREDAAANQQAEQLRREQESALKEQQREADRAAKEAADAAKRAQNIQAEAEFRQKGISHYTDAAGDIQPDLDETGNPVFKPKQSQPQWDNTGKAFVMERDEKGQTKQKFLDADAPIGTNPNDPNDKALYRQNKFSPWDRIEPEEAIASDDPRVRNAAAGHLKSLELSGIQRKLKELSVADAEAEGTAPRPTRKELEEATQFDLTSDDPVIKARGQAVLDRERQFADRAKEKARLQREALNLEALDNETFAAGRRASLPPAQAERQRVDEMNQRRAALEAEAEGMRTEVDQLEAESAKPRTAEESAAWNAKRAGLAEKVAGLQAKQQAYADEATRFNDWQKRRTDEAVEAQAAPRKVWDAVSGWMSTTDWAKKPTRSLEELAAPAREGGQRALIVRGGDWELRDGRERLPEIMAHPKLAGKDIYLSPFDQDANIVRANRREVTDRVNTARQAIEQRNAEQKQVVDDFIATEGTRLRDSGASVEDIHKALGTRLEKWANDNSGRLLAEAQELANLQKLAFDGIVPVNRLVDAWTAAGRDGRIAPPVEKVLDAAGSRSAQDIGTQEARSKALQQYISEYAGTPLFDEQHVAEIADKQAKQLLREKLQEEKGWLSNALGTLRNTADQMGQGLRAGRLVWNYILQDDKAESEEIKRTMEAVAEKLSSNEYQTAWSIGDQFGGRMVSFRDYANWLQKTAVETVPQMLPTLGTGAMGGILGRGLGRVATHIGMKGAAAELAAASNITGKAALELVKKGLAAEAKAGAAGAITKAVQAAAVSRGQALGMKAGAFLGSLQQNGGELLSNTLAEFSVDDLRSREADVKRAIAGAMMLSVPAAALDLLDGNEKAILETALGEPVKQAHQRFKSAALKAAKEFGVASLKEGGTGFGQAVLGVINARQTRGDDMTAMLSKDEVDEIVEGTFAEAAGGGVMKVTAGTIGKAKQLYQAWQSGRRVVAEKAKADAAVAKADEETAKSATGLASKSGRVRALDAQITAVSEALAKAEESGQSNDVLEGRKALALLHRARGEAAQSWVADSNQAGQEINAFGAKADAAMQQAQASGDPAAIEAAQASIDMANRAGAVLVMATGADIETMPLGQLRALGLERGSDGAIAPMKDVPTMVYRAADGSYVLTDDVISGAAAVSPTVARMVAMTESQALERAKLRAQTGGSAKTTAAAGEAPTKPTKPTGESVKSGQNAPEGAPKFGVTVQEPNGNETVVEVAAASKEAAIAMVAAEGRGMVRDVQPIFRPANAAQGEPAEGATLPHETKSAGKDTRAIIAQAAGEPAAQVAERTFGALSGVFDGDVIVEESAESGGFGVRVQNGRISLVMSPSAMQASAGRLGDNTGAWVEKAIIEEAVHAAALRLEMAGKLNAGKLYASLPVRVRQHVVNLYGQASDRQLGHEFLRMLVQDRIQIQDGKLVSKEGAGLTESVAASVLTQIRKALEAIQQYLTDLVGSLKKEGADAAVVEAVKEKADAIKALMLSMTAEKEIANGPAKPADPAETSAGTRRALEKTALEPGGSLPDGPTATLPDTLAGRESADVENAGAVRKSLTADSEWVSFDSASGTLGIPRSKMPQISAEQRGALANFLRARGIEWERITVSAATLKPSQAEYSTKKVQKAREFKGATRAILVSADGYVVDGHHQWKAALEDGQDIEVIRLAAPIDKVLATVSEFPSAETSEGKSPNPVPGVEPAAKQAGGNDFVLVVNGERVRVRYVVQEAADARPSHDAQGNPTPGYDQTFQPRDRSLPEYRKQAANIARNLSFEQAAYFPGTDTPATTAEYGPPVMTANGDTLIGNGREIGTLLAYRLGTADGYKAALVRDAEKFGLDPAAVAAMKAPVLKRQIIEDLSAETLLRISQESNEGVAMGSNAVELAGQDATRLTPEILSLLDPEYDVDATQNKPFLTAYATRVVKQGASAAEANLTPQELARRARMGIFAAAYGLDAEGRAALDRMSGESGDSAKRITRALQTVAPLFARMRRDIAAGELYDRDITRDIGAAVAKIAVELRDQKKAADAWAALAGQQSEMQLGDVPAMESAIRAFLVENRGNRERIEEAMSDFVEAVYNLGDPRQADMFGGGQVADAAELWRMVTRPEEQRPSAELTAPAVPVETPVAKESQPVKEKVKKAKRAAKSASETGKKNIRKAVEAQIEQAPIPEQDKASLKHEAADIAPEGPAEDAALRSLLEGLYTRPMTADGRALYTSVVAPSYRAGLPKDRMAAAVETARLLLDAGVTTPEPLAEKLTALHVNARKFSQAIWNAMQVVQPDLEPSAPDWATIYDRMDNPRPQFAEVTADGQQDFLSGAADEPFNLAAESEKERKAREAAELAAENAKRQRDADKARKEAEKAQGDMFSGPAAGSATSPGEEKPRRLLGMDVDLVNSRMDSNGILVEVYSSPSPFNANAPAGVVRAVDADSGNNVLLQSWPTLEQAQKRAAEFFAAEDAARADEPFAPGDTLTLTSPNMDGPVPVNYRGPLNERQSVVVMNGNQISVPTEQLRRPAAEKGGKPEVASGGQRRAAPGGEYGPNGEWYPGGSFIATTTQPKGEITAPSGSKEAAAVEPQDGAAQSDPENLRADALTVSVPDAGQFLQSKGITVTKAGTKTGKTVWRISGKTFDHKSILKNLGAKWYAPEKSWSLFTDEDPTQQIADAINGRATPASQPGTAGDNAGTDGDTDEDRRLRELRQREDGRPDERRTRGDAIGSVDYGTVELLRRGLKIGIPAEVVEDQIEDVGMISAAYAAEKPLFVLANEAGTGKTFVLGGAIRELRRLGAERFIYVTMNQDLVAQIQRDLSAYGMDGVEFVTYSELSTKMRPDTNGAVVIFDEAHNVKNAQANRAGTAQTMMGQARFTILASATPFENPVQAEYLAGSGVFNPAGGFVEWGKAYGANVRRRKFYNPQTGREQVEETLYWTAGKLEDGIAARQWFVKQGVFTQRKMRLNPEMTDVQFLKAPASERWADLYNRVMAAYEAAMAPYRNEDGSPKSGPENAQISMHMSNTAKRILEAAKVNQSIAEAQRWLARTDENGNPYNVVVFVETKADRFIGRYSASERYEKRRPGKVYTYPEMRDMMIEWEVEAGMAKMMGDSKPPRPFAQFLMDIAGAMHDAGIDEQLPSVEQEIVDALGGPGAVGVYTGNATAAAATKAKQDFLAGSKRVLVATMAKGGTGLSLHDTVGNRPTVQININLPWVATGVDQVSGRVARYGLQSKANIKWMFADNIPFERQLAGRVGRRMRDMGALVKGIESRAATILTGEFDFTGTVSAKQVSGEIEVQEADIFEQAARLEKNRRQSDDHRNGFFETPFPLAALMTVVSGARGNVLEPSAGKGNLVRLIKDSKAVKSLTMVELRSDNADYLATTYPGARLVREDFMSWTHDTDTMRFDTVLMNPPFERIKDVGAQDVAHVRKAYDLLAPHGRMVAIMGEGAFFRSFAQEKEFRDWLGSVGAIVVQLPENAFKNSGTGVRTRMVVIDRRAAPGRTDLVLDDLNPNSLREVADAIPQRRETLNTRPISRVADEAVQAYFQFHEVPASKQSDKEAVTKLKRAVSNAKRTPALRNWQEEKERAQRAWRGLIEGKPEFRADALAALQQGPVSSLLHALINREIPSFDVRGAVVEDPRDVMALVQALRSPFVETLKLLVLDSQKRVIGSRIISVGSLNETVAHPRELVAGIDDILRGFKGKVSGFIISHNHPAGNPAPSPADRQYTKRVAEVSGMIGIPFLDHVVTNGRDYFSFREIGMIQAPGRFNDAVVARRTGTAERPDWQKAIWGLADAEWEVVSTVERQKMSGSDAMKALALNASSTDPGHIHVVYLDTRLGITAIERLDKEQQTERIAWQVISGAGREGAHSYALLMPDSMSQTEARNLVKRLREGTNVANIMMMDAIVPEIGSMREAGLVGEEPSTYSTARWRNALRARQKLLAMGELNASQRAALQKAEAVIVEEERKAGQLAMFADDDVVRRPVWSASMPSGPMEQLTLFSRSFTNMLRGEGIPVDELDAATERARMERSGERTIGRPELSLGAFDPVIMGMDETRMVEEQTFEQWNSEARAMLKADYEGTVSRVMEFGRADGQLDPVLTRAAQLIVARESRKKMTPAQQRRMQWLVYSYRRAGTEQARGLAARRDPFMTPEDRHREFLMKILFTPPEKTRRKLEAADSAAERERIMQEQRTDLERIKKELRRMGVSLDDLFGGAVSLVLKNDPIVQKLKAGLDAKRQAAATALQTGASFADVAKSSGLSPADVAKLHGELREKAKAAVMAKLRAMREASRSTLNTADLTGGGSVVDAAALAAMSDAEAEAAMQEIAEKMVAQMGFLPREKQGKMKVAKGKKRKPLFRPPPPRGAVQPTPEQPAGPQRALDEWESWLRRPVPRTPFGTQPRLSGTTPPADASIPPGPGMTRGSRLDIGENVTPEEIARMTRPVDRARFAEQPRLEGTTPDADESFTGDADEWGMRTLFPEAWDAWDGEHLVPVGADLGRMEDVISVARAAQLARASGLDMLNEWWINNLLSGPTTHVRNLVGNVSSLVLSKTLVSGIESLLRGQPAEMKHLWKGLVPGIARGWRLAKMAWVHQADFFKADVLNAQLEFEGLVKGEGTRAAIPGRAGDIIRIPGRFLAFVDALFKGIIAQMEAGAQAYRIAKAAGLKGEALTQRMQVELNTPNSQAWQLAVEKAEAATFQTQLKKVSEQTAPAAGLVSFLARGMEEGARRVSDFSNSFTLLKFIVPFIRTPYNILRTGIRMSPAGSLILAEELISGGFARFKHGRPMSKTHPAMIQHAAEQIIGWTAAAILAGAVEGDDDDEDKWLLVTGTRQKGAQGDLQARTYPATSIRIFGKWFNYGSIEPIATTVGVIADAVRSRKTDTGSIVASLRGQIDGKTFLKGLADTWDNVERMAEGKTDMKAESFKLAMTALVPNIIRQPLRAADDLERDWKAKEWWHDAAPYGGGASPRIDATTGEPVRKPGNFATRLLFPFLSNPPEQISAADKMLMQWNRQAVPADRWAPDEPSRILDVRKDGKKVQVELNGKAYEFLQRRAAVIARQLLPAYRQNPDERTIKAIKSAFEEGRARAREELRRKPLESLGKVKE